jgi:hypothetical protein
LRPASLSPPADIYSKVGDVGLRVGGFTALGGVVALVIAAAVKTFRPADEVVWGDWIAYGGAIAGLFSLVIEITRALGG